jgi:hypothetical protein
MSKRTDAFDKAVKVNISDHIIKIRSRNQGALKIVVYSLMLLGVCFFMYMEGFSTGSLYLLAVFAVVAYLIYQEIRISLYPLTILDVKKKSVLRKSIFGFIKPKSYQFNNLIGISMNVQAVGGYTSADEDENTDYEKTLILETEKGEVPLFNFVSRVEEAEEGLAIFVERLKDHLSQASVAG